MVSENYPALLSIQELKNNYIEKKCTPEEVIAAIIKRANDDETMNIWIEAPSIEKIQPYLEQLESIDPEHAPLWGIPFAIKDNIDLAGVPTTAGCATFGYEPDEHATVVGRLIAAGAIPVGKTNLDQFATGLVGTRSPYGETHNALRPELISGGSSAGSAVAVARGQVAFALGTDTAGSGRVPAALNNLVGLKTSVGAWPTKGVVPACASIDCVTVFANSLEDVVAVDDVARGIDKNDPWSKLVAKPGSALPKKICLPKGKVAFYGPFADQYEAAWNRTLDMITALDIPVEYIDYQLFNDAAEILYGGPWVAERWSDLGEFIDAHPGEIFPVTEQVLRSGSAEQYDAASVFTAMHKLQAYKMEARKLLEDAVLVLPTAGGTWTREQVRQDPIATNSDMGSYTNHCNLLDLCAIAIPAGDAEPHTPFGITMFALAENEDLVLGAADLFLHDGSEARAELDEESTTLVAVCGLHMRGFPLEKEMLASGATFAREATTASKYQFVKLPTTPPKPGLIKKETGGGAIEVELWKMPKSAFANFVLSIPAPLGIGKVELSDGCEVPGFICEGYQLEGAEDITAVGGWRAVGCGVPVTSRSLS
ncbi:allophanate hydrolase [Radiobacillus sp. PE A8.2]|uniref:allophanate hydrolase n=1 Tax=Radiobacillus sp. PE A8.2 TaxID=3380349 RepID=UPI003891097C